MLYYNLFNIIILNKLYFIYLHYSGNIWGLVRFYVFESLFAHQDIYLIKNRQSEFCEISYN